MNYREEQGDEVDEENSFKVGSINDVDGEAGGDPELGRGDILSAPDAMALDPEGYKRHFDFYLKYYSTKMRIQGGQAPSNHPVQMLLGKQPAPVPSSAHPVQMLLKASPSTSTPPVPFSHGPPAHGPSNTGSYSASQPPIYAPNYVPDFNRPPPNFSRPPPSFPTPPPPPTFGSNSSKTNQPKTNPSLTASNVEAATEIKK